MLRPDLMLNHFFTIFRFSFVENPIVYQRPLQGHYVDVVRAYKNIENVKCTISKLRSDADNFHR